MSQEDDEIEAGDAMSTPDQMSMLIAMCTC